VVSAEIGWGFLALALVGCIAVVPHLRHLRNG
jgi:hypothetical protein